MERAEAAGLKIARTLYDFVNAEAILGTGVAPDAFWSGFAGLLSELAPRCAALLAKRDLIQGQIDAWHLEHRGKPFDQGVYLGFLREIGYLVDEPASVAVATVTEAGSSTRYPMSRRKLR